MLNATSDARTRLTRALVVAATTAGSAPSIHNTQPWHWRVDGDVLDLYAEPARQLPTTDPDGRLMVLSCGAALHHARVALAADGYEVDVTLMPSADDQDHLATIAVRGPAPVTAAAIRMARAIGVRHTDRRPLRDEALSAAAMTAVRSAASPYGVNVDVLARDKVIELAAAVDRAQRGLLADAETRDELTWWTNGRDLDADGIPDSVIPDRAPLTNVPGRDFGHPGSLPISEEHDQSATYAILSGAEDDPQAWLNAGQALSAMWLVATEWMIGLLPLSAPIEMLPARQLVRDIIAGIGHPYMAVRLGLPDTTAAPIVRTARRPASQTVIVDESLT